MAVEVRLRRGGDEELRAVAIFAAARHREAPLPLVLVAPPLVVKHATVDRLATSAVAEEEIATLPPRIAHPKPNPNLKPNPNPTSNPNPDPISNPNPVPTLTRTRARARALAQAQAVNLTITLALALIPDLTLALDLIIPYPHPNLTHIA